MTERENRLQRIADLGEQRQKLLREVDAINEASRLLWLEDSREDHPCSCVRLNREIGVHDMSDTENRYRRTFGIGLVAELLSADKECPLCRGTGVPEKIGT